VHGVRQGIPAGCGTLTAPGRSAPSALDRRFYISEHETAMSLHLSLLRPRLAPSRRSSGRRRLRPWLDSLEDRTVLSTGGVSGAAHEAVAAMHHHEARLSAHAHIAASNHHHGTAGTAVGGSVQVVHSMSGHDKHPHSSIHLVGAARSHHRKHHHGKHRVPSPATPAPTPTPSPTPSVSTAAAPST